MKKLDYQGQKMFISEVAELNGVNYQTLWNKYQKTGDINQAVKNLIETQRGPHEYIDFFGQKMTLNQIAKLYGINWKPLNNAYQLTSNINEAISICVNDGECVKEKIEFKKNIGLIDDKLKNLPKSSFPETSLKGNDHTLLNNSVDSFEMVENKILIDEIYKLAPRILKRREMEVICLRYGLDDGCSHTLEEIANKFSCTKQYIKEIEAIALAKLRRSYSIRSINYAR